jgi:hypothetical protein
MGVYSTINGIYHGIHTLRGALFYAMFSFRCQLIELTIGSRIDTAGGNGVSRGAMVAQEHGRTMHAPHASNDTPLITS